MDNNRQTTPRQVESRLSALMNNASAIKAITGAVEGTIGPKGLDTMLVDRSGDVVVTNAGVTILDLMEVSHPAARMLINIARAQHGEIGDGTTTATIMAGTLVTEGLTRIMRGVPPARVIQGIQAGVTEAMEYVRTSTRMLDFPGDPLLYQVALVAGRGDCEIAENITNAAKLLGLERLMDPSFKLKDVVMPSHGSDSRVLEGVVIKKRPLNETMPDTLKNARILCIDDSLEVDRPQEGALRTEAGFQLFMQKQQDFKSHLNRLVKSEVNVMLVNRGVSDEAEQILTDGGCLVISRLPSRQLRRVARHTGAIPVKRPALAREPEEMEKYLGTARTVQRDKNRKNYHFIGGSGQATATYLVGAPTEEVEGEKERIATDAASALQAAVRGGVVAGGGAVEIAASRALLKMRAATRGMEAFGIDCVIEALHTPLARIVQNAGFNPLEKVEEVVAAQNQEQNDGLAVDCDTGRVTDMIALQVVDPTMVKLYALKAAGEVARAILRINTIIKMKDSISMDTPLAPSMEHI